jgi:hypothetical protein
MSIQPIEKTRHSAQDNSLKETIIFILFFVVSRLALLAIIGFLVKGRELSNDALIHLRISREPFLQFMGLAPPGSTEEAYPPLLALFEGIFMSPLRLYLPDFYAVRLTFIIYETLAAFLFCLTLRTLWVDKPRLRYWSLVGFILIPMGWMSTVIMPQDEVISEVFLILVAWLVATQRQKTALFVCGLAVISAKIFFVIPLLALILVPPRREIGQRILIGFAPLLVIYGWTIIAQLLRGNSLLFEGFTPANSFCINIWVILVRNRWFTLEVAKSVSSLLALAGSLLTLAAFNWQRVQHTPLKIITLLLAMFLWVFAIFYHINPEYYTIVLPLLLLIVSSKIEIILLSVFISIPWAVNLFDGVNRAIEGVQLEGRQGKTVFVKIYQSLFPVSPTVMQEISLWVSILFTLGIAIVTTRRLLSSRV